MLARPLISSSDDNMFLMTVFWTEWLSLFNLLSTDFLKKSGSPLCSTKKDTTLPEDFSQDYFWPAMLWMLGWGCTNYLNSYRWLYEQSFVCTVPGWIWLTTHRQNCGPNLLESTMHTKLWRWCFLVPIFKLELQASNKDNRSIHTHIYAHRV